MRGVIPRFVVFRKIYDGFCFRDFVYFRRYLIFAAVRRLKGKVFARRIILVVDVPAHAFDVGFCGRKSCGEFDRRGICLVKCSVYLNVYMVCRDIVFDGERQNFGVGARRDFQGIFARLKSFV